MKNQTTSCLFFIVLKIDSDLYSVKYKWVKSVACVVLSYMTVICLTALYYNVLKIFYLIQFLWRLLCFQFNVYFDISVLLIEVFYMFLDYVFFRCWCTECLSALFENCETLFYIPILVMMRDSASSRVSALKLEDAPLAWVHFKNLKTVEKCQQISQALQLYMQSITHPKIHRLNSWIHKVIVQTTLQALLRSLVFSEYWYFVA